MSTCMVKLQPNMHAVGVCLGPNHPQHCLLPFSTYYFLSLRDDLCRALPLATLGSMHTARITGTLLHIYRAPCFVSSLFFSSRTTCLLFPACLHSLQSPFVGLHSCRLCRGERELRVCAPLAGLLLLFLGVVTLGQPMSISLSFLPAFSLNGIHPVPLRSSKQLDAACRATALWEDLSSAPCVPLCSCVARSAFLL